MGKDIFQIGEVAAKIGVQPESIRYYERIGLEFGIGTEPEQSRGNLRRQDVCQRFQ